MVVVVVVVVKIMRGGAKSGHTYLCVWLQVAHDLKKIFPFELHFVLRNQPPPPPAEAFQT
jgi:hypothetical protein